MPKSTATIVPSRVDEQVALVHVGMEEAVAQGVAQEGLDQRVGKRVQIVAGGREAATSDILMPSIHSMVTTSRPVRSQSTSARGSPDRLCVFSAEFRKGGGLEPQIHLDLRRLLQRLGDLDRTEPAGRGHEALLQVRHEIEGLEIACETLAHAGPDDLDGDLAGQAVSGSQPRPDAPGRSRRRRSARSKATNRSSTERPSEFRNRARSPPRSGRCPSGPAAGRDRAPCRCRRHRAGWRGTGRA